MFSVRFVCLRLLCRWLIRCVFIYSNAAAVVTTLTTLGNLLLTGWLRFLIVSLRFGLTVLILLFRLVLFIFLRLTAGLRTAVTLIILAFLSLFTLITLIAVLRLLTTTVTVVAWFSVAVVVIAIITRTTRLIFSLCFFFFLVFTAKNRRNPFAQFGEQGFSGCRCSCFFRCRRCYRSRRSLSRRNQTFQCRFFTFYRCCSRLIGLCLVLLFQGNVIACI